MIVVALAVTVATLAVGLVVREVAAFRLRRSLRRALALLGDATRGWDETANQFDVLADIVSNPKTAVPRVDR